MSTNTPQCIARLLALFSTRSSHLRSGAVVGLIATGAILLSACGSSNSSTTTTTTKASSTTTSTPTATTAPLTTSGASTAAAISAASKTAMSEESSVRYSVAVTNSKTKTAYTIVADLGGTSGMQTLQSGTALAYVRVNSSDAYFSGNSAGLTDFFGMPSKDVTKVGASWVAVPSGSSQYTSLMDSDTLGPIATTLYPSTKKITLVTTTYLGHKAHELSWTQTEDSTTSTLHMYISTSTNLPLYAVGIDGTVTQAITFSHWNEKIAVAVPSPTIPFSSVS